MNNSTNPLDLDETDSQSPSSAEIYNSPGSGNYIPTDGLANMASQSPSYGDNSPYYIPSDGLAVYSWQIDDISGRGNDVDVQAVWPTYTGRGINVGVYDDGVQSSIQTSRTIMTALCNSYLTA
jgi:hypothetical protein